MLDDVGDVSIHENIRGFDVVLITQITSDRFLARPPAHGDYQALPGDVTPTQLGIGVPAQLWGRGTGPVGERHQSSRGDRVPIQLGDVVLTQPGDGVPVRCGSGTATVGGNGYGIPPHPGEGVPVQ